jgi:hypothetical protein
MNAIQCCFVFLVVMCSANNSVCGELDFSNTSDDEVMIGHACVQVPIDRLLLIRRSDKYYAVRFFKNWESKELEGKYAQYESFVIKKNGDGIEVIDRHEGVASHFPLKGPFRPFLYQPGNPSVVVGDVKLVWQWKRMVCMIPVHEGRRDHGYEFAATKWININDVNLSSSKINWYGFSDERTRKIVKIDDIW